MFTHKLAKDTEYYRIGPWQRGPSDGAFSAGTLVMLLNVAGSFCQVRNEEGVEGWVPADSLELLRREGVEAFTLSTAEDAPYSTMLITTQDTPYFTGVPMSAGQPADGLLPPETKVAVLDLIGGGQVRIRTEDGAEAWTDISYLQPLEEG
jgi:hypothetical protein